MRFIIVLFAFVSSVYAVVTVAPVEIGSKPGIGGVVEASLETARGNTDKDEFKGGVKVQYDNNNSYVAWIAANINYAEAESVKNTNKTYLHLRYIHTYYGQKNTNYELFAQSQTNEFTKVKHRYLMGGGYRFHLLHHLIGKLYVGGGAFYEHINYTTAVDEKEDNLRANIYAAYSYNLGDDSKLSYVGYYQPKFNDLNDFIATNTLELQVHVYKRLFMSLKVNYDYDSRPAIDVEKRDFSQTTSFVYEF